MVRRASVTGARSKQEVAAYLPNNYMVTDRTTDEYGRVAFIIIGEDDAGWTLDDYVIPRLASGLMWCKEIKRENYHG